MINIHIQYMQEFKIQTSASECLSFYKYALLIIQIDKCPNYLHISTLDGEKGKGDEGHISGFEKQFSAIHEKINKKFAIMEEIIKKLLEGQTKLTTSKVRASLTGQENGRNPNIGLMRVNQEVEILREVEMPSLEPLPRRINGVVRVLVVELQSFEEEEKEDVEKIEAPNMVQLLLQEYREVFQPVHGLFPPREHEHDITSRPKQCYAEWTIRAIGSEVIRDKDVEEAAIMGAQTQTKLKCNVARKHHYSSSYLCQIPEFNNSIPKLRNSSSSLRANFPSPPPFWIMNSTRQQSSASNASECRGWEGKRNEEKCCSFSA
ncbi:hypothetical protein M5K25_026714 [Dendrobium thyrsiflorum]|uniref:Uncharacterized protein n=1 Tax=Dendrobium thyrsiflorum TaxID=117978 RepID=A0ABD0TY87_DENTH